MIKIWVLLSSAIVALVITGRAVQKGVGAPGALTPGKAIGGTNLEFYPLFSWHSRCAVDFTSF